MKKYKLTNESIEHLGRTLYRIEALKGFGNVTKGDKGGYIEKEGNLSQDGDAWVSGDARVYGDAWVYGNARVYGNAEVNGNAEVSGNARVSGNAEVYGNARVYGNAEVYGNARVFGNAEVSSGYCFAYKAKDWNVTEVESGNGVLLIKDYIKPEESKHIIVIDGKKIELSEESFNNLKEQLN